MKVPDALPPAPKIKIRSHDQSSVSATFQGNSTGDIKMFDESTMKLSAENATPADQLIREFKFNWTKWGTVATIAGVIIAGIALWAMFYLDKN